MVRSVVLAAKNEVLTQRRLKGDTLLKCLCNHWGIAAKGPKHFPDEGAGILIGPKRAFMPFAGVIE